MYSISYSRQDDMMERAAWGPDVCLYIGPGEGRGQNAAAEALHIDIHPITYTTSRINKDYMYSM